jgi:hypothetical protein
VPGGGFSRWLAIGSLAVLAVIVVTLAFAAYGRAHPAPPTGEMEPAPTFTLGVRTAPAAPTASAPPPDQQRLLSIDGRQWWRATAGECGGAAPVIERSSDGGATWSDVTPNYLGIEQVLTVDALITADAEVVAAVAGCNPQALRTYTRGEFWESYPEVLAASRFIEPKDGSSVRLSTGRVAAPCDEASGLHARGDVVALLCGGRAWSWQGTAWLELAPEGAVALTIDGEELVVAHTAEGCAGVAISRVTAAAPDSASMIGCADSTDPAQPLAIDISGGAVTIWSGDAIVTVS